MSLNQMPPHIHRSKWESDLDGCSICIAYRRGQDAMREACIAAVKAQPTAMWGYPKDSTKRTAIWVDDAVIAIESLGGER